jgi:anaerobic ribonucleoside-triphosphate reductase activating protein
MKIHRYLSSTTVNGPGKRFAIWVQGCSRNCAGCFNSETQDKTGGEEMSVDEIMNLVPHGVDGITISGGEPFLQAKELAELLELVSKQNLHRLVYTGFTYEELIAMKNDSVDKCLLFTDMLIDGEYKEAFPQRHPLAGSGNQRVLILEQGKIVLEKEAEYGVSRNGEFIIDSDGNIAITGFMDSRVMR